MLKRALLFILLSLPAMAQGVDQRVDQRLDQRVDQRLDPAAIAFHLPAQIPWGPVTAAGNQQAILVGDPAQPGFYAVMNRWLPGHMSRPHSHPHDRFITVLSGTWWMGTGTRFDPDSTVPVGAGSFVTHFARGIHYDGAKNEEVVLLIVGEGPGTATPAQ